MKGGNESMRNLINIVMSKIEGERRMSLMICALTVLLLTGCGTSGNRYTKEELGNLARLEIYEAGSDELLQTIEDEETLYQYNQAGAASEDAYTAAKENELKESAEEAGEMYYIVAYKYPAAKFGDKEPEKNTTLTLFQDTNVAKMVVDKRNVKNMPLPEELLTFYYEMSEEESTFYESLFSERRGADTES